MRRKKDVQAQTKRPPQRKEWDSQGIRELRRHLRLTQDELSAQLGMRQQTISEWENNEYKPRGSSRTLLTMIAERAGFIYGTDPIADSEIGGPATSREFFKEE